MSSLCQPVSSYTQRPFTQSVTQGRENDSIKIKLECLGSAANEPIIRHLTLRPGHPIIIGRGSKSSNKNIVPGPDNAFFDCPVMSRNHAELVYDATCGSPNIRLTDTHSLHGTYVNQKKVARDVYLTPGETIRFGDAVSRQQTFFHGIEVRIDIDDWEPDSTHLRAIDTSVRDKALARTNTFRVPSDSGDDVNWYQEHREDEYMVAKLISEDEDVDDTTPSDYAHDDDDDEHVSVASITRTDGSHAKEWLAGHLKDILSNNDAPHPSSGSTKQDPLVIDDGSAMSSSPAPSAPCFEVCPSPSSIGISEDDWPGAASDDDDQDEQDHQDEEEEDLDDDDEDEEDDEIEYAQDEEVDKESEAEDDQDVTYQSCSKTAIYEGNEVETLPGYEQLRFEACSPRDKPLLRVDTKKPTEPAVVPLQSAATLVPTQPKHTLFPASRQLPRLDGFDLSARVEAMRAESNQPLPSILEYCAPYRAPRNPQLYQNPLDMQLPSTKNLLPIPEHGFYPTSFARHVQPFVSAALNSKDATTETSKRVGSESKKRKRGADEEGLNAMDLEMLLNDTVSLPSEVVKKTVHESIDSVTDNSESSMDVTETVKTGNDQVKSCIAKLKVPSMADGRPRKRARVSSVSLALTAAAGAVGGCVATVSFLWSPLAERLLA